MQGIYGCYVSHYSDLGSILLAGSFITLGFCLIYINSFTQRFTTPKDIYGTIIALIATNIFILSIPFFDNQQEYSIYLDPYMKSFCMINWSNRNYSTLATIAGCFIVVCSYVAAAIYFMICINRHFANNVLLKAPKGKQKVCL